MFAEFAIGYGTKEEESEEEEKDDYESNEIDEEKEGVYITQNKTGLSSELKDKFREQIGLNQVNEIGKQSLSVKKL